MNTNKFRWILFIYLILVLVSSSIPGYTIPRFRVLSWDKLFHFIEFMILGFLAIKSLRAVTYNWFFLVIMAGIVFAGINESIQYFVSGRTASVYDGIADIIGIIFGGALTGYISYIKK